ncbi:MAG TPA: DUF6049 family protein [Mycobacterium sp.]|nr:DUF6049 family protein [Mycobacterium sp.]
MIGPRLRRAAGTWLAVTVGMLTGPVAALCWPAVAEPDTAPFVAVRIDSVTPDVLTARSDPVVTVTGTVTNVGDRPVHDIMVRLEHAAAVATSAGLRTSLAGTVDQYQPVDTFVTVAAELQRGQDTHFSLSAPLRSPNGPALDIDRPGVYPVLVNVNGTPDYGEPARLDDARFLLPVTGLPGTPERPRPGSEPPPGATGAQPVRLTVLWPLADRPRLAPGIPGGTVPVRLTDDDLATSLAPGGRLDSLLSAVESATSPEADPDQALIRSVCLAADPDLLVTVNAMVGGYVVAASPDDSTVRPGTGQGAAAAWLGRLRGLAHRMCIAPIPYAQADLGALHRVGDPGLAAIAAQRPADIIDRILDVNSLRDVTPLGDGPLTADAVSLLDGLGDTVAIVPGDCSAERAPGDPPATADVGPLRVSRRVAVAPFDPAVGAALAAVGTDPATPTYLDPSLAIPLQHESAAARRQDALGALLWRGLAPADSTGAPRTEVVLPPTFWSPRADDAQAVLTALTAGFRAGSAVPQPLPAAVAAARATAAEPPQPPADGPVPGRFDIGVVDTIADQAGRLWGLTSALTTDTRTGLTGDQYTAPLREDMLRALSQSQPPDLRNELAATRLASTARTIDDLFGAVTIVHPADSYTLATEHSPLPLALRNDLAVPIRVRLQVDAPAGMTVADVGEIDLPPGYLPLRVPVEVHFNQRVAVDVALTTPGGLPLGESARLSVHANAYGMVLFLITVTAGTVLAALTARRLWHRFRGQPDRADLDRPGEPVADGASSAATDFPDSWHRVESGRLR